MPHQYARIFLLSHMRAYTSLLGHILGSHPDVNGYYEMHLSYVDETDLDHQEQQYTTRDALKPGSRYLFDKLLHNDYELNLDRFQAQAKTILITLRHPEATIKSIVHLFAKKGTDDLYANPLEAAAYYINRLQRLSEFCQRYPHIYYYFDAELIASDTPGMLDTLTRWLQLESPLSPRYQRFSKTGIARAGDTSPAISSGEVISQVNQHSDIALDADVLQQAMQAYRTYRHQMISNAITVRVAPDSTTTSSDE